MKKYALQIVAFAFIFLLGSCKEKQNQELNQVITEVIQEEKAVEEKVVEQEPVVQEVKKEEKKEEETTIERPATYDFSFEGKYYTPFMSDELYGVIDDELNVKLKPAYMYVSTLKDGYYCYFDFSSGEFYNKNMELVYSSDSIHYYGFYFIDRKQKGFAMYSLNLNDGSISKFEFNENYNHVYFSGEEFGLVLERDSPEKGLSVGDYDGNVIARNIEEGYACMKEGLMAVIFEDGRSGFIDKSGNLAIEMPLYVNPDWIGPRAEANLPYFFEEGIAVVRPDEKTWVLLDKNGNTTDLPEIIQPADYSFSEGLLAVRNKSEGNKVGFMNKEMEIEIPCVFDSVEYFRNGYAIVVYKGEDAVLDKQGNVYLSKDLLEENKEPFTNVMAR